MEISLQKNLCSKLGRRIFPRGDSGLEAESVRRKIQPHTAWRSTWRRITGFIALQVLLAVSFLGVTIISAQAGFRNGRLWLITTSGKHEIKVEIARTPHERALGLMYRASLPRGHGMLFLNDPPQEIHMWMQDTRISLDMIFIRADGLVHRVEANTEPYSKEVISSLGPVTAVLELAAGEAARLSVKPGDGVHYSPEVFDRPS